MTAPNIDAALASWTDVNNPDAKFDEGAEQRADEEREDRADMINGYRCSMLALLSGVIPAVKKLVEMRATSPETYGYDEFLEALCEARDTHTPEALDKLYQEDLEG